MNTGIQDANNLAWKLAFVLKHHADDNLLDSYFIAHIERVQCFKAKLPLDF